jgi:hypothetical protein
MDHPISHLYAKPAITKTGLNFHSAMAGLVDHRGAMAYPQPALSGVVANPKVNMSYLNKLELSPAPRSATQRPLGMVALEMR